MRVSVVMPIYNTGEQLYKTLMSIIGQKEKDFEVLMVDDCSSDELTREIEETFERFDNRFKLLKAENSRGGAAFCRNFGLGKASGDYIVFLDSDDLFRDDFLSEMALTMDESGADICIANFMMQDIVSNEKSIIYSKRNPGVTDRVFCLKELGDDGLSYWMPVPWNKMFRRTFLLDNNIAFQNLSNCNDMYFGYMSAIKAQKIVYCRSDEPLVIYRVNNHKQISYEMDSRNMVKAYELLLKNTEDKEIEKMLIEELQDSLKPMMSRCHNKSYNEECLKMAHELMGRYQ